jgi:hypothetical protein
VERMWIIPPHPPRAWRRPPRTSRGTQWRSPAARATRVQAKGRRTGRARERWNPREIEARKHVVARIPKHLRPPEEIRVSVFEKGGHLYADVRVYRGKRHPRPTANGLPIHFDLVPAVLAALTQMMAGTDQGL